MLQTQPVKFLYVNQSIPVRKKSNRSPFYLKTRNNQVAPRPAFTCIDEIYSSGPLCYPTTLTQTSAPSHVSSQETKDYKILKNQNYRKWLLAIIIIVIIICIIVIIVLLAVFLTR